MSQTLVMDNRQIPTAFGQRTAFVLQWQYLDTLQLRAHLEEARQVLSAAGPENVSSVLGAMSEELSACSLLLRERISSLSPGTDLQEPTKNAGPFCRMFDSRTTCQERLEALLSGYLNYARTATILAGVPEILGDATSSQLMATILGVADRSIWLISFSLERLPPLGIDDASRPKVQPCA